MQLPGTAPSGCFRRNRGDLKLHGLYSECGVMRSEPDLTRLLGSAYPYGARTPNEREGIIADERGRPRQFESNGIFGKRPDGVEFVGDAENDARGVGSVGNQRRVVGQQREFLIDALA